MSKYVGENNFLWRTSQPTFQIDFPSLGSILAADLQINYLWLLAENFSSDRSTWIINSFQYNNFVKNNKIRILFYHMKY